MVTKHLLFRIILSYVAVFQLRILLLLERTRNILPTRNTRKRCQGGATHQLRVRSQGSLLVPSGQQAAAPLIHHSSFIIHHWFAAPWMLARASAKRMRCQEGFHESHSHARMLEMAHLHFSSASASVQTGATLISCKRGHIRSHVSRHPRWQCYIANRTSTRDTRAHALLIVSKDKACTLESDRPGVKKE